METYSNANETKVKVTFIGKYFGQKNSFNIRVKPLQAGRLSRGDYYTAADIFDLFLTPSQRKRYNNGLRGKADYYNQYKAVIL